MKLSLTDGAEFLKGKIITDAAGSVQLGVPMIKIVLKNPETEKETEATICVSMINTKER